MIEVGYFLYLLLPLAIDIHHLFFRIDEPAEEYPTG